MMNQMQRILLFPLILIVISVVTFSGAANAAIAPQVTLLTPIDTGIRTPVRVITDQAGYIYIADPRSGGVVKLSPDGFAALPSALIKTDAPPAGIALTARGDLLVAQGTFVQVFTYTTSSSGTDPVFSYTKGTRFGAFQMANGIAVATDGTIFVTDSTAHKVYRFNSQYALLGSFGSKGNQDGEFNLPTAVAFEKVNNQFAVVDTLNGRIQFFTTTGLFVRTLGALGADPNANDAVTDPSVYFTAPQGLAFEYTHTTPPQLDRLYVADSYQSRVQVIDPAGKGQRLRYIGTYGTPMSGLTYPSSTAEQFKLVYPADVAVDPVSSRVLVANGFGNLMTFGIDGGTSPVPGTTTQPKVTFTPPPTITATDSFTLSGTVDQPAIISVDPELPLTTPSCTAIFTDVTHWSCTVSGLPQDELVNFRLKARPLSANGAQYEFTSALMPVLFAPAAPTFVLNPYTSPTAAATISVTGTTSATAVIVRNTDTSTDYPATLTGQSWGVALPLSGTSSQNNFAIYLNSNVDPTQSFVVERILLKPSVIPAATGSVTNSTQNISGTINGVSEVTVTLNGTTTPVTVPVINGIFSTALNLQNGSNTIVINARDASGTSITPVPSFTYTFDPSAPAVAISGMTSGSIPVQDGGSTVTGTLTLAGTAPAGAAIAISLDNGTAVTTTADGSGAWTYPLNTTPLTAGQHTVFVSSTDSGTPPKTGAVKGTFIIVPPATPQVSVTIADSPTAATVTYTTDSLTSLPTVYISGTAVNAIAVSATHNGSSLPVALDAAGNTYIISFPVTFAATGPQTVTVTAYAADGTTATVTRSLIFSQTPPQTSAIVAGGNVTVTAGSGLAAAYTLDGTGAKVPITLPAPNSDGSTTFNYPLGDATLTTLTFADSAGNISRNGRIQCNPTAANPADRCNGEPTIMDAFKAMRINIEVDAPTIDQLLRGDVAPLVNGEARPDGVINAHDVIAILRRVVGIKWK